jgi:NitT/TauT family transport system permease protein
MSIHVDAVKTPQATVAVPLKPVASERYQAMALAAVRRKRMQAVLPWLVALAVLVVWEVVCRAFNIPQFVLPPPSAVAASIAKWWSPLMMNAGQTLMTTLAGFSIAVVVGLLIGVALGSSTLVYHGLYPLMIAFESVPKVAIVPILVLWFGIGTVPAVLTSFLIAFFPIAVNVSTGIATVEPELRDVLRALGAKPLDIVKKIGIPRAMPYFFASLKIAITFAFVGSIVSETVGANKGIGHLIMLASSRFDVPLVFAGLVITSVMGVSMYVLARVAQNRVTGWATRGRT